MFEIANTPRDYAWGSRGALSALAGHSRSNDLEAELWLGDHAAHSAYLAANPTITLREWIAANPKAAGVTALPFLLKILAIGQPLSIQVHPTREQARDGFAAENARGIAVDSPERNYRDDNHKPEIVIALSDGFSALSGFRDVRQVQSILDAMIAAHPELSVAIDTVRDAVNEGLHEAVVWILGNPDAVRTLSNALANLDIASADPIVADALDVARLAARHYPGDPGAVVTLVLNHVVLAEGEALFVPAGCMHAYLHGLGVEVMASSDNVVRGGLTAKHSDTAELSRIMDSAVLSQRVTPLHGAPGVDVFPVPVDDFAVTRVLANGGERSVNIEGPAIAVVTAGRVELTASETCVGTPTRAFFIESGEVLAHIAGNGTVFVAHRPAR